MHHEVRRDIDWLLIFVLHARFIGNADDNRMACRGTLPCHDNLGACARDDECTKGMKNL